MKVAAPSQGALGPLGPIQVIPPGLLGLLQLKQLGRLPDKLADTVAGVIELRDWYLTARRVDNFTLFPGGAAMTTGAVATGGQGGHLFTASGANCVVPQTQLWWVEQYSAFGAIATAADTFRANLAVTTSGGASFGVSNDYQDTATGRARQFEFHIDRGFWAFPGDQFVLQVEDIVSAAGITFSASIRATPCPI